MPSQAAATAEEETFDVESIIDYTNERGIDEFFIKWLNYSEEWNSWEPRSCLDNEPSSYDLGPDVARKLSLAKKGILVRASYGR